MPRVLPAALCVLLMLVGVAQAEIVTKTHTYRDGDHLLEGRIVYDDAIDGKRPGVLVIHQWMGITDHEMNTARQLAELGYVAFVGDIYGKNARPENREQAGQFAGKFKSDTPLFRRRVTLALKQLTAHDRTDPARTAALGFCFGGTAVLELARSGADLDGVVSFHGGLKTAAPANKQQVIAKVLVCHGAADPHVPWKEVVSFTEEMQNAGVDYQFIAYADAVHAFTQPSAGNDPSQGAAYNESAAQRSWLHMQLFFNELFGG